MSFSAYLPPWIETDTDVPGWIGDIPTYLAFIAAAIAAFFAWRTYRNESVRLSESERRAQADGVAVWIGGQGVVLANTSGQPVYDVVATAVYV